MLKVHYHVQKGECKSTIDHLKISYRLLTDSIEQECTTLSMHIGDHPLETFLDPLPS